jgi:hypothetical protein
MSSIYPAFHTSLVPYQHKVQAVGRVLATNLHLDAPTNPYPSDHSEKSQSRARPSGQRYNAQSAASAFAAHILVEADLTGQDPFAPTRRTKAYQGNPINHPKLRLVA